MGLDTTHDAFSGAYSAFNRFRQAVTRAIGGSFPPHDDASLNKDLWYWGEGYGPRTHPGLYEFFLHSDCEGDFSPEACSLIADEMEALLPLWTLRGLEVATSNATVATEPWRAGL